MFIFENSGHMFDQCYSHYTREETFHVFFNKTDPSPMRRTTKIHAFSIFCHHYLLPPILLHHQDLNHPDEDVEEVQLQADTLIDSILLNQASLS